MDMGLVGQILQLLGVSEVEERKNFSVHPFHKDKCWGEPSQICEVYSILKMNYTPLPSKQLALYEELWMLFITPYQLFAYKWNNWVILVDEQSIPENIEEGIFELPS